MSQPAQIPEISVVIASCNRRKELEGCLASLAAQRGGEGRFELVVVNDGSRDDTAAFLEEFRGRAPIPVTVVNQENAGVAAARNRGVALARGALIGFTDDDCLLPEDWIATALALWRETPDAVAGIGGPLDTVCNGEGTVARYLEYLDEFNHVPVLTPLLVRPRHLSRLRGQETVAYLRTSNSFFQARVLREVGGFDERFRRPGGEDPDLCYRILKAGYGLQFTRALRLKHLSRSDFRSYFGSLRNYVRGEFINSSNRELYPEGAIRRSYAVIPLQKVVALGLGVATFPLAVLSRIRAHGRVDGDCLLFPALQVASKAVALRTAWAEQLSRLGGGKPSAG